MKRFILCLLLLPVCLLAQNTEQPDPLRPSLPGSAAKAKPDSATRAKKPLSRPDTITFRYRLTADGTATAGNVNRVLLQLAGAFDWSTSRQIKFSTSPAFAYGKQAGVLAEREYFADFRTTYHHEARVYYLAFGSAERSNLRQILSRYSLAAGAGVKLLNHKRAYLSITDVILHENTDFVELADLNVWRNSARLYGEYSFDKDRWTITHTVFYQPAFSRPNGVSNVRWNGTLSIQLKMNELLSLRALFANSYESLVDPGRQNNDLRATLGVVYGK